MANTPQIDVPELAGISGLQWSLADQTATGDTITTVLKGKADYGELFNSDTFNALREERVGEYGWYAGHSVRHGYGRQFDEVDLTAIELNVTYNKSGYYSRFEVSARTESRPLEEKEDAINSVSDPTIDETYKAWWNYQVRGTGADLTAGQITTLKAQASILGGTGIDNTTWVKSNQALKKAVAPATTGERVLLDARFPGVQSYGVGALQVKEIVYARSEAIVKNVVGAVGYLKVPRDSSNTYYDDNLIDPDQWIVTSASYKKRLGWYEGTVTFAYAKGGWLARLAEAGFSGVYPRYY